MLIGKTPVTAILIGFQPIQSWTPRELQTSYFSPPGEMRGGGVRWNFWGDHMAFRGNGWGGGAGKGSFVTNRVEREYYRKWTTD